MELTNTHSIIRGYSITSDGVHIEYYIRWVLRLAPGKEKQNGSAAHPVAGKV